MNVYIISLIIIFVILINLNIFKSGNVDYMTVYEMIKFNILLGLIKLAGITNFNRIGSEIINFTSDPIMIKYHRELQKKYKSVVKTCIVTQGFQCYILDPELSKKILMDSPEKFSAGFAKEKFFKKFMPHNVGIAKCLKTECPWKKQRQFNELALGTNYKTPFFNCIPKLVNKNITKKPTNIWDFREISYNLITEIIYGNDKNVKTMKQFMEMINSEDIVIDTPFYKEYIKDLNNNYRNAPECSLLHYANKYRNNSSEIIDDEIPHWFLPFIFVVHFLIPNMLCVLLNNPRIYSRVVKEAKDKHFDIYSKTTYLHFCVIEHIRLFNTININIQRTVNYDNNYNGIEFKKGEQIFLLFSSILRNEKEFKKPDEYIPERWKKKSIDEQNIVFGVGPQTCPSKQISPVLYKSFFVDLLRKYDFNFVAPKLDKELYYINPYHIRFSK